ncbi:MAG: hypothetical protein E7316_03465 [Clostridiales bacterium]|nr:hypothetical protein [Clostridiales bacterium]
MRKIKRFFDVVPAMLMWLMLSIFLWGFVFNILTDVPAAEKVVLFIDAPLTQETHLAVTLEEAAGETIKMVQVRPFSYAMMGSDAIEAADLYIVGESSVETYRDWFAPLPRELQTGTLLELDGRPLGVRVYDAATSEGIAAEYIGYTHPGKTAEDHYLFIGVNSLHVKDHDNAVDNQAVTCALALLNQ